MHAMELYQLKSFIAVARERNLTRAAEKVFASPPAVSAQLKALEDELGVRLFERTPRGMELTDAGARLLDEAERTLDAAHRLRSAAAQLRGAAQGVVRLGTVHEPAALRLGEVLVQLAERHPGVTLQLHQGLSVDSMAGLQQGTLDCAYVMSDRTALEGMELLRLAPLELVVALPVALAEAHPALDLNTLLSLPWVGTPPGCALRQHLEALFASGGRAYQDGPQANTEGVVRSMVASGFGAGIVRADQATEAAQQGELRVWPGWRGQTWLCWVARKATQQTPAVAVVRQAVLDAWA